jgi:hypothetical protein
LRLAVSHRSERGCAGGKHHKAISESLHFRPPLGRVSFLDFPGLLITSALRTSETVSKRLTDSANL